LYVLGGFVGIKREGQVVAMACLRLHCPGYREISTVATRPGQTGRGYGTALVRELAQRILDHGETPFLAVVWMKEEKSAMFRQWKFIVTFLCAALMSVTVAAQKTAVDAPVEKLGAFLGKWHTEGTFSNGGNVSSELECRWSPQRGYLICEQ